MERCEKGGLTPHSAQSWKGMVQDSSGAEGLTGAFMAGLTRLKISVMGMT